MTRQPRLLTAREQDALNKVRRRVAAIVFGAVTLHAILALIGVSLFKYDPAGDHARATGLLVMSGFLSVFQYVGIRLILNRSLLSWWILAAATPTTLAFIVR
jgi:hypothetical protein